MVFSRFAKLCNHHYNQYQNIFISPTPLHQKKKKTIPFTSQSLPTLTASTFYLYRFAFVDISHKWNQSSLLLSFSTIREHREKAAVYKPGSGLSPGTKVAGTLIFNFPASGTGRNKFLLFKKEVFCDWLLSLG